MTAILGGGISGLSSAYYALENPRLTSLVLYEASNRLGGWINSKTSPSGSIFEKGPRTLRLAGPAGRNTLILADKLGLSDQIIPFTNKHPGVKNRLIFVNGKLHLLPNSINFSALRKMPPFDRGLISILKNDLKAAKCAEKDESLHSFVERRFGRDVADYLMSPMICGICAGDAKQISVNFLMKSAFELEQKYGSVIKGYFKKWLAAKLTANAEQLDPKDTIWAEKIKKSRWAIWTLKGGLEQLPRALAKNLESNKKLEILKASKCSQITFFPDHVELSVNGKNEHFRSVVSSLMAKDLAPLLMRQHPQLARELQAIPAVDVIVVNLKYSGKLLPMEAFGLLVAPKEEIPILGIIFDSCLVQSESSTILTVMMGGAWYQRYFGKQSDSEYLLKVAQNQVQRILNIKETPVEYDVSILKNCIPQYVVGHQARLERIKNYISSHRLPLALCGSSYQGVGLNDVILSAKEAVSHIA